MFKPAFVDKLRARLSRWRVHGLAVAILTLGGTALFGILHAILIVPIWPRLPTGLPRALITSLGMTWCYSELLSHGTLRRGAGGGVVFGVGIWLALLPVSFVVAMQRVAGVRSQLGWLEPPLDLLVAAATGAALGYALTRSRRVTVSAAACMAALLATMTAPIAVELGTLQRLLLAGYLPIYIAAGTVLSMLLGRALVVAEIDDQHEGIRLQI